MGQSITDLTKKIIGFYISTIISKGKTPRPVDILEFYETPDGVLATYKTTSLIGTNAAIIKRGLFTLKNDNWFFGELEYRKTEAEYLKERDEENKANLVSESPK